MPTQPTEARQGGHPGPRDLGQQGPGLPGPPQGPTQEEIPELSTGQESHRDSASAARSGQGRGESEPWPFLPARGAVHGWLRSFLPLHPVMSPWQTPTWSCAQQKCPRASGPPGGAGQQAEGCWAGLGGPHAARSVGPPGPRLWREKESQKVESRSVALGLHQLWTHRT